MAGKVTRLEAQLEAWRQHAAQNGIDDAAKARLLALLKVLRGFILEAQKRGVL
jgi:hypothetical protein